MIMKKHDLENRLMTADIEKLETRKQFGCIPGVMSCADYDTKLIEDDKDGGK